MASDTRSGNNHELGVDPEALWQAADKLRGSIDAADYKHVVLGLIFLKYISDAFQARRAKLAEELAEDGIEGEQAESLLEERDEYTAVGVFWVSPKARWEHIQAQGKAPNIGKLIDDAMYAIEHDNPKLKGKLPRDYARRGIAPQRLGGLIDLIGAMTIGSDEAKAKDVLGRVYEYFLGKFAAAEGKLGGEFFTPRSVVRLLVEMIEPYEGRVYDPCCGSGGMFVQSEKFTEAHGGSQRDISIFGQESNLTTWRLAHMNLAIRGIEANLGEQPADSFMRDLHPDVKADYILANPPFNISDWSGELLRQDARWKYGVPPTGNANYAWIQHFIHHLAPANDKGGGVAGFVMANGSLSSVAGNEREIRRRMVEDDLVDCIVAMPPQLFLTTPIPVCLWIVSRNRSGSSSRKARIRDRQREILFIDARAMGTLVSRTLRALTGCDQYPLPASSEVGTIARTYHAWRGEPQPQEWDSAADGPWGYRDIPGFCRTVSTDDVAQHGFDLFPGLYVGSAKGGRVARRPPDEMQALVSELTSIAVSAQHVVRNGLLRAARDWDYRDVQVRDIAKQRKKTLTPTADPDRVFQLYSIPAFDYDQNPEICPGAEIMSNKTRLSAPCVLFSRLNPRTPRIWLLDVSPDNSICSTEFLALEPVDEKFLLPLYCALRSTQFTRYICMRAKGSTGSRQRVKAADVLDAHVRIPVDASLDAFNEKVMPLARFATLATRRSAAIASVHDHVYELLLEQEAGEQ